MKVEKKSFDPHPEGWFLFVLGDPEMTDAEWKGKITQRLKWPCTSVTERTEDGKEFVVNLFTGVTVSPHPADMHRQLVEDGFGIDADDYEDTDDITGKLFAGKVEWKKETGRPNIVKFDTQGRIKPKAKAKVRAERDPFENE